MGRSELIHVTVSGNSATSEGGGLYIGDGSQVDIRNSIFANNGVDVHCLSNDVRLSGTLIESSSGHCPAATLSSDPMLGTFTGSPGYFPLSDSSPAIGAGDSAYCTRHGSKGRHAPEQQLRHGRD